MDRRRIRYVGRVQGVGFRYTARSVARRHPVTGWVRNEPDGSVLMEVQGAPTDVDAALADLRSRLSGYIRDEQSEQIGPRHDESTFEITF